MRNAADEAQVRRLSEKEKQARERELADLKAVLNLPEGRRVFGRLLKLCKMQGNALQRSAWEPSAKIHYNVAVQDVGNTIVDEMLAANPDAAIKLLADTYREQKGLELE